MHRSLSPVVERLKLEIRSAWLGPAALALVILIIRIFSFLYFAEFV